MNEGKKDRRDPIRTVKPRNFVAKNMTTATSGAGAHKDKKKAMKQGDVKHKKKDYAESLQDKLATALKENSDELGRLQGEYSDFHKDLHGFRPRHHSEQEWNDLEMLKKAIAGLHKYMDMLKQSPEGRAQLKADGWQIDDVDEELDNPEYNDEAGMATGNLYTLARAVKGLHDTIGDNDNLPEWCQEKIAKAEQMLVGVWDYLQSQKDQGIDPKVAEAGYGSNRGYHQGFASPTAPRLGRGREDDEYHNGGDYDPEFQRNRQETTQYNVTVNGKPMTEKPFLGRSAALAWAKQQVNAGTLDPKEAKLSPVQYSESVEVSEGNMMSYLPPFTASGFYVDDRRGNTVLEANDQGVAKDLAKILNKEFPPRQATGISKLEGVAEGAKVDRQAKHITASMMKKGKSKKDAEAIAWAHIKHPKKKKAEEGWTHDSLADQLFEHERTYEDKLANMLNKKLGK